MIVHVFKTQSLFHENMHDRALKPTSCHMSDTTYIIHSDDPTFLDQSLIDLEKTRRNNDLSDCFKSEKP